MPKFYVSTGSLNRVISRTNPKAAAKDAVLDDILNMGRIDKYGDVIEVNETGFKTTLETHVFQTPRILTEIGVL